MTSQDSAVTALASAGGPKGVMDLEGAYTEDRGAPITSYVATATCPQIHLVGTLGAYTAAHGWTEAMGFCPVLAHQEL